MAYVLLYFHEYYDIGGTLHRVEILEKDYSGGSTRIEFSAKSPVRLRHFALESGFEEPIIQGQELVFAFRCNRADIDTFDALFESAYKDHKVKY